MKQMFKELFIAFVMLIVVVVMAAHIFYGESPHKPPKSPPMIRPAQMQKEILHEMENEYNQLGTLLQAKRMSYGVSRTSNRISVGAAFKTDLEYSNIHNFYMETAQRNSWTLVNDGQYDTGNIMAFRKGDYKLKIAYYLKKETDGSNLLVDLVWTE